MEFHIIHCSNKFVICIELMEFQLKRLLKLKWNFITIVQQNVRKFCNNVVVYCLQQINRFCYKMHKNQKLKALYACSMNSKDIKCRNGLSILNLIGLHTFCIVVYFIFRSTFNTTCGAWSFFVFAD